MTEITILFGTESGASELEADDIAESLNNDHTVVVENMSDFSVEAFSADVFYLVICSSYGEGELPYSAKPFYDALTSERPDLSGVRYAVLGRGDTSYLKTYLDGPKTIDSILSELGAVRLGDITAHDASDWKSPEDLSVVWAQGAVEEFHKIGAVA